MPRKNIITSRREAFKNLLKENVSEFTTSELRNFLSFKEEQYEDRRRTIKAFCDLKGKNFGRKVLKNSLIFDPKDGLGYCQIAKVASSTWCNHFITLGKLSIILDELSPCLLQLMLQRKNVTSGGMLFSFMPHLCGQHRLQALIPDGKKSPLW